MIDIKGTPENMGPCTEDTNVTIVAYTPVSPEYGAVIAARYAWIENDARCTGCYCTREFCQSTPPDPAAPFSCCGQEHHVTDERLTRTLMDEIERGEVRPVSVAHPSPKQGAKKVTMRWLLDQDEWWQPEHGPVLRIADMTDTHRYHLLGWLEKRAADLEFADSMAYLGGGIFGEPPDDVVDELAGRDPLTWLKSMKLHRALTKGLPDLAGKKKERKAHADLVERARHWSTCPRSRDLGADACTCRAGEGVNATETTT